MVSVVALLRGSSGFWSIQANICCDVLLSLCPGYRRREAGYALYVSVSIRFESQLQLEHREK